jgi:Ca-activated chloride channel family protein
MFKENIESFSFAFPWVLLLLVVFAVFNYFRTSQAQGYYMPHASFYKTTTAIPTRWQHYTKWLMIFSAILSLANPLIYQESKTVKEDALDIVLALDTSGSMSLYGFNPNNHKQTRLEAVQEVVIRFIQQRKNDRIGLVVFGTHSSIASPLSFDKEAQTAFVKALRIGALGKSTALIDSIVSSVQLLKESSAQSKIIILLSDGEDSSSKVPLPIALKLAKKYGIKIYTIIIDQTHSNMMKLIAKASHTKAYNPKNKEALTQVYAQIDTLEKSKLTAMSLKTPQPLYGYFLFISILSGLLLLLRNKVTEVL